MLVAVVDGKPAQIRYAEGNSPRRNGACPLRWRNKSYPSPSMSTTTARRAGSSSSMSRGMPSSRAGSATPNDRTTAGSTPASPEASYAGGRFWSNTEVASVSNGRRQRSSERHGLRQRGLAVGIGTDPQPDVVSGDGPLIAVVGLAARVAAGRRHHVDPADRTPAKGQGELASQRAGHVGGGGRHHVSQHDAPHGTERHALGCRSHGRPGRRVVRLSA